MTDLAQGANTTLGPDLQGIVLDARWDVVGFECDLVALACNRHRKVPTEDRFVYFNNLSTRDGTIRLVSPTAGAGSGRAQIQVHLAGLGDDVEQVVLALAIMEEGRSMDQVRSVDVRAFNPNGGADLASYDVGAERNGTSCLVLGEVYRHRGQWKFRAIGQGYNSGLHGLVTDYGVMVG